MSKYDNLTKHSYLRHVSKYFSNAYADRVTIRVGSSYYYTGGSVYKIQKFIKHPYFNPKTYDYDVAVIKLAVSLTWTNAVMPIGLASYFPSLDHIATVTGWGCTSKGGAYSPQLQRLHVPVIDQNKCYAMYSGKLTNRMFCAGYKTGNRNTCKVIEFLIIHFLN